MMRLFLSLALFFATPALAADADVETAARKWKAAVEAADARPPAGGTRAQIARDSFVVPAAWRVASVPTAYGAREHVKIDRAPLQCNVGYLVFRVRAGTLEQQRQVIADPEFKARWFETQKYPRANRYATTLVAREGRTAMLGVYLGPPRESITVLDFIATRPDYVIGMTCVGSPDYGLTVSAEEPHPQIAALAAQLMFGD